MHFIDSSCRRRGTSTVLGTLIFIGIMFTAVIPMFLVMNQADTIHEIRKHELEIMEEERGSENIFFYALPLKEPEELPKISFIVENRGERLITIERIWLNDEYEIIGESISSMGVSDFGPFDVLEVEESYIIKLITDKGNFFMPSSGIPTYTIINGWQMDSFTIFIMMTDPESQLHIFVKQTKDGESQPMDPHVTYFDDTVAPNQPGYSISVPLPGEYYVEVTKWHGTPNPIKLYPISGDGLVTLGLAYPTVLIII